MPINNTHTLSPSAAALHWCRRRDPPYYVPVGDTQEEEVVVSREEGGGNGGKEEEEEEEGLFKADAVNEEGFECDHATQVRRRVPPCYVPRGDSPVSLLATILRE